MTRYARSLQWIEDAEAKRLASMMLDRVSDPIPYGGDPGFEETQSWIMAMAARVAIRRIKFGSLTRTQ
jgi:hypothetical protein